jgi:hypothetical protein
MHLVWTAPLAQEGKIGDAASVGCGHVSGPLTRRLWPLALMKSADWGPNQFVAHEALETLRAYPIPGSTGSSSLLTNLAFPSAGVLKPAEGNTCYRAAAV